MDTTWKDDTAVENYRAFFAKYIPGGDLADGVYVAGFSQGEILEKILQQCGNDLSRDNILKQALSLRNFSPSMAIPGIVINTGADNHQAWTSLQLQSFDGKSWVRFGKLINAAAD
jgi:branched-chain amino acid transport system substrate-binding protein